MSGLSLRDRPVGIATAYGGFRQFFNVVFVFVTVLLLSGASQAAGTGPLKLLVLGDSLTAGYGVKQGQAFTDQLSAALQQAGRDVTVINGGVSGDTTAGGAGRLGWLLADRPDAAIVELGANDALRGLDPAATRANLRQILTELRTANIPVLLAGMLAPPNLGREYGEAFNKIYPDLAEEKGVLLYPFFLEGVAAMPELNQQDGIHPNPEGIAVVTKRILPYVLKLLDQADGGSR
ncbi:arylesterase [Alphaproteobacteria bacterium HT1-32]|nr:arylesterase [Alphaproteobacteria bacterium HT1-32]